MVKLVIDSQEVVVPAGTKVIDAAERLGIIIPRFCYHPALGSSGACRVCAVKFEEGPVRGLEMSCMVEAKEGMVVSTTDKEAVDFRKYIIEWLMINHPRIARCAMKGDTVFSRTRPCPEATGSGATGERSAPTRIRIWAPLSSTR